MKIKISQLESVQMLQIHITNVVNIAIQDGEVQQKTAKTRSVYQCLIPEILTPYTLKISMLIFDYLRLTIPKCRYPQAGFLFQILQGINILHMIIQCSTQKKINVYIDFGRLHCIKSDIADF